MRRTTLVLSTGHRIQLLVPETDPEREHGMNGGMTPRPYAGMLFNFDPPTRSAGMTMERTPISLQLAFIGPDHVVHTLYDAKPYSGVYEQNDGKVTRWVVETYGPWKLLKLGDRVWFEVS